MKIEEAIVYLIAGSGHGMTVEQLTEQINVRRLHIRKDGQPVTLKQVYAVIMRNNHIFVKEEGRIRLTM
ncbi:MAG: hypothetical protein IKQ46_06355 [Bacteroidales bacterium]|nr:hypothetical protein [Bacteroidales bacterium]